MRGAVNQVSVNSSPSYFMLALWLIAMGEKQLEKNDRITRYCTGPPGAWCVLIALIVLYGTDVCHSILNRPYPVKTVF